MNGRTRRMTNVAAAKAASMTPMVVADRPIATPKMGTTNKCVSQAPDRMVLTIRMRRSGGTASSSVMRRRSAGRLLPPVSAPFMVRSGWRSRYRPTSDSMGPSASMPNARRVPRWSIARPAISGPENPEAASASDIQEKLRSRSRGSACPSRSCVAT
ncbi:Uncharacterised protein [Bordetella pertussis]|nr:Uncharacterised protein [Bordetella pertussis]